MKAIAFLLLLLPSLVFAQNKSALYKATLLREDGIRIVFNFKTETANEQTVLYIINAAERLRVDSVKFKNDSVFIKMPVFESSIAAKVDGKKWNGNWTRATSGGYQVLPFTAVVSSSRFDAENGNAKHNISGRWAVKFESESKDKPLSIAEFKQQGNKLSGTFLTPTGDYRYLEGIVTGNRVMLSGFDGAHALLFTAELSSGDKLINGQLISGARYKENWTANKNAKATVKSDLSAMFLKPGEERLNFHFPDLSGNEVSINDNRFKNKVVVVQLLGSWCPNCMDETAFLSELYNSKKYKHLEIVALAYEYSTDYNRSVKSLQKFQKRFNVEYPILITGVTVSDTLRTEKTIPQVTRIKVFPSSIIIDKSGKVRKLDTGFYGPGTGKHFEAYKREFFATIDRLAKENTYP